MGEAYRDGGYLYAQVIPVENLDPKNKIVNVTFNIYEGEVAFLNRLEFRGNNYTKDKVIRREMLIREGDRFSLAYFKDSILRIKQLGLVDLEKDPDIKPNPDDPTKIDVQVNVKELQRNNIQFTAGYSGYEGTFVALSYSTVNFLGAGENLEFTRPARASGSRTTRSASPSPISSTSRSRWASTSIDRRIDYPYLVQPEEPGDRPDAGRQARRILAGQPHLQLSERRRSTVPTDSAYLFLLLVHVRQSGNTTSARSRRSSTGRRSTAR